MMRREESPCFRITRRAIEISLAALLAVLLIPASTHALQPRTIVEAARAGDIQGVYRALLEGESANSTGVEGVSAVLWAVSQDRYSATRLLLANGGDPLSRVPLESELPPNMVGGDSTLHLVARNGSVDILQFLFEQPVLPDLNLENSLLETPLIAAARRGDLPIFVALLEAGANLNLRGGPQGATPIWYAAQRGHHNLIDFLATSGLPAELDATASDGSSPLIAAVRQDFVGLAGSLLLLGADPDVVDNSGRRAIDYARSQKTRDLLSRHSATTLPARVVTLAAIGLIIFTVISLAARAPFPAESWQAAIGAPLIALLFALAVSLVSWPHADKIVSFYADIERVSLKAVAAFLAFVSIALSIIFSWRPILSLLSLFRGSKRRWLGPDHHKRSSRPDPLDPQQ